MPNHNVRPTFSTRKGVLVREYHVVVAWPDGRREKFGRFPRKPDAVRWIKQKSGAWLEEQKHARESHLD